MRNCFAGFLFHESVVGILILSWLLGWIFSEKYRKIKPTEYWDT